jgi:hypothetical protein|tara:strand:+ start:114 stop:314 length:201 start_codon:yes stop_codon:yes gene_type:complete
MKNPFTKHPHERGRTYWHHLSFATRVGLAMLASSLVFLVHAVFPFVPIPKQLNLESAAKRLLKWNS